MRITHILGTSLGVGGTTLLEIYSIKFLKDSSIDPFEHDVIKVCINVIRYGLILLVFSGLGLVVLWRLKMLGPNVFFSDRMLAKTAIVVILLSVAILMNLKLVNPKIGGAISTASWYTAMILGIWRNMTLSFFSIMASFVGLIILVYFILEFFRQKEAKSR